MTHRLLLEQFAPPAVLVDRNYEILYFFGPTDRYLAVPAGDPTQDLMLMAREGLRTRLRPAIHKAVRQNGPVTLAAQVKRNGDFHPVIVTIRPVPGPQGADALLLVTFQDSDPGGMPPRPPETVADESVVQQLEHELKATKEDLQSTIEDLESSNEELKISNEEVMSMNEELQSSNEELETSKEELQSLNEELTTVNNQLEEKVHELESADDDMANLLNCTEVAIIFLDNQFRIKRYTPPATRLFNLISTDLNRPFSDITPTFHDDTLQRDIEQVLRTFTPREKQVRTPDGCWWHRRITVYRTHADRIEGVVLTFADVTQIKQAAEQAQRFAAVLLDSNDAVTVQDLEGKITAWNHGAERMFGYSETEALTMNAGQLVPEHLLAVVRAYWERLRWGERTLSWESERRTKGGRTLDVWVTATTLKDELGRTVAIAKTERDVTKQKELEREVVEVASLEQRRIGQDLHDSVGQELAALSMLAGDLDETWRMNPTSGSRLVERIVQGLQRSQHELRAVLRGLLPVAVDNEGLMAALSDLADRIPQEGKAKCKFDCPQPVTVADNLTATHLYLIAQEAVHNAVKHARPVNIRVFLESNDCLLLSVQDDGIGMKASPDEDHGGLGLRIMRNRASIIGATLTIQPAEPTGTLLTCVLSRKNHEAEPDHETSPGADRR